MRRVGIGQLLLLGAICSLAATARAGDLPYAGNWKITVLQQASEINVWLVKIDNAGKKVELLSGLGPYKKTVVSKLEADAGAVRFVLTAGTSAGNQEFFLAAYPPKGKDRPETLLGTVRVFANFIPVRIEKTESTQINPKTAQRQTGGFADFNAIDKTKNPEDRVKNLKDVVKTYTGKPILFLAARNLLGELLKKKADADAFKPIVTAYLETAAPFGREMQIQANSELVRFLLDYDKTAPLGLGCAREAARLLKEDDNWAVRLGVLMALAGALHKNDKKDEIEGVVARLVKIGDDVIVKPRTSVGPLISPQQMAAMLLSSPATAVKQAALKYARKAMKLLEEKTPLADKLTTHKLLRAALTASGQADEAQKATAAIDKLEDDLDKAYLADAIPFKPEKFAGRKGRSNRAVVVELFTGAESPPFVAAEIAFDALARTYSAREVVLLEYHLHIPHPDPMTNPDAEARSKFYGDIKGAPTLFIDGKVIPDMGGARLHARARYDRLRELISKVLETDAEAKLKLAVTRKGDRIDLLAGVSDLTAPGARVKLRFVLVEETVRYVGSNGLRLHHHVVRALPGGADGIKLEKKSSAHVVTVNVTELRKMLDAYLTAHARKEPFSNPDRPLALKKLKVVALIQEDDSKKILQAVEADVPEAKD